MVSAAESWRTPRLALAGAELRAWAPSDATALVAAWNDDQVSSWNPVPPQPDLLTAKKWIDGVTSREDSRTSLDWVIDVESHGGVVGEVGLSGFNPRHGGALIGYWLLPAGRGHGFASVAVSAVTQWAHAELGLAVLVARCHPDNPASGAVVARVGYRKERQDGSGHELWFSRARGV